MSRNTYYWHPRGTSSSHKVSKVKQQETCEWSEIGHYKTKEVDAETQMKKTNHSPVQVASAAVVGVVVGGASTDFTLEDTPG